MNQIEFERRYNNSLHHLHLGEFDAALTAIDCLLSEDINEEQRRACLCERANFLYRLGRDDEARTLIRKLA